MNVRLAFVWIREQMLSRASHRIAVGPEQHAKEEAIWEQAVAEVDDLLEPAPLPSVDETWGDAEWVSAMGGEMAGVS